MGAGQVKAKIVLACAGVSALAVPVMAQVNLSFEKPTTTGYIDDGNALINDPSNSGFWGWGYFFGQTGTADKDSGVQANTNAQMTANSPDGTPQDGWVNGGDDYLYQDVGALLPNTTYTLTVACGSPGGTAYGGVGSGNNQPMEIIELLNGNNVLTGTTNNIAASGTVLAVSPTITPPDGTFADNTITYATGATVSGDLTVLLENTSSGAHEQAMFDDVRITGIVVAPPQWSVDASGDWNVAGNWSTGVVPNAVGAEADFFGAISSNHTVFTDQAVSVGTINFNNANMYEITGTGSLTLQTTSGNAQVIVQQGTQEINLPTAIASNTIFNVAGGATLIVANPLTINSGKSLTQTGAGTVTYQSIITVNSNASIAFADSTHAHELSLASSATATLGGPVLEVDSISNLGTINLLNNKLLINYGSGPDPIASIAAWIKNGYYNLAGPQIISTDIVADDAASGLSYGIGYADSADPGNPANLPSGTVEVMFTLLGDANLDGVVNSEDFTPFSQHLGLSGGWDDGDFNYDGTVNAEDFTLFSHNLGQSATLAGGALQANGLSLANVPEPMSAGTMVMAGFGMFRRRRRRSA
jgi:hypothetical protein